MTNLQLLLSIGVPSLLVILGWFHQNQRLTDLRNDSQRQFDNNQRQFTEIKSALATLSTDYQRFYGMEQRLEGRVDELARRVQ